MSSDDADPMLLFLKNERMSSIGFQGSLCRTSLPDTAAVQHKLLYLTEAKSFIRFSLNIYG